MKNLLIVLTASAVLLTGCATGGSVGDMAIGDDSTAIKAGRNRAEAQLSRAELDQHRRKRTNVSEELDLEQKKRSTNNNKSVVQWVRSLAVQPLWALLQERLNSWVLGSKRPNRKKLPWAAFFMQICFFSVMSPHTQ